MKIQNWKKFIVISCLVMGCGSIKDSTESGMESGSTSLLSREPSTGNYATGWTGVFFNSGNSMPASMSPYQSVNFNWGQGSPALGVNSDHFSAQFVFNGWLDSGMYQLNAGSDDGIQVSIDGSIKISDWTEHSYKSYGTQSYIEAGYHTIVVDYFELTGEAALYFDLVRIGGGGEVIIVPPVMPNPTTNPNEGNWSSEYFPNPNLGGSGVRSTDGKIDFNWGQSGPQQLSQNDYFSVRWTKSQYFNQGKYTIKTSSDDGVRVYVDGKRVIDDWEGQSVTENKKNIELAQGTHSLVVEYFENTGDAVMKFSMRPATGSADECPTKVANIVACAAPWTQENQSFVKICKWENGACVPGSETVLTSYANDGGVVKVDGFEYNQCTPVNQRPMYQVIQSFKGQMTNAEIVQLTHDGNIKVGFCQ